MKAAERSAKLALLKQCNMLDEQDPIDWRALMAELLDRGPEFAEREQALRDLAGEPCDELADEIRTRSFRHPEIAESMQREEKRYRRHTCRIGCDPTWLGFVAWYVRRREGNCPIGNRCQKPRRGACFCQHHSQFESNGG